MRKTKILFCVAMLLLLTVFLAGCRCAPETVDWYLIGSTEQVTFMNGVTKTVSHHPYIDLYSPFAAVNSETAYAKFNLDKTVSIKLPFGEEMNGTYEYRHNYWSDTSVTITLDNGEVIVARSSSAPLGPTELYFEYAGGFYTFGDSSNGNYDTSAEEYEDQLEYNIVLPLREEFYKSKKLTRAQIQYDGEYKLLIDGEEALNFSSGDVAVYALRLTKDNELIVLDSLTEGECFVALSYNDSHLGERSDIVTVYYVEPHRDDVKLLSELEWLPEIDAEIESITVKTSEPDSMTTRTERTVVDREEIAELMTLLHSVTLLRMPSDAFSLGEKVEVMVIIEIDRNQTVYLSATDGYIYTAAKYWRVSDWPSSE